MVAKAVQQKAAALPGKRGQVRGRLLNTGGPLIADRGLARVSVEDILAAAEVSRRTFYGYFANKYELVAGLLNPALDAGAAYLSATPRDPQASTLARVVDCYLYLWQHHSHGLTIIAAADADVMPYIDKAHRRFGTQLKKLLQQAERAGELRNADAAYTFRIITRTAVPLLKIYADHPDGAALYRESMLALLADAG